VPTYQYACTACEERLEVVQSFSDDPLTECPSCGGRLRKVFSAAGIIFKGSGFYRTDSRSGAKPPANGAGKKSESTESGSESKGSESKGSESKGSESKGSDSKGSEPKGSGSTPKESKSSGSSSSSGGKGKPSSSSYGKVA
jgi:putative FmdB family regulatory protein